MSKGYNIVMEKDQNANFLRTVKKGNLIRIEFMEGGYMLAIVKSITLNALGDQWHSIEHYGLYNSRNPSKFEAIGYCGCTSTCHACKPTFNDYLLFQDKMKGHLLNRKKIKEDAKHSLEGLDKTTFKWT